MRSTHHKLITRDSIQHIPDPMDLVLQAQPPQTHAYNSHIKEKSTKPSQTLHTNLTSYHSRLSRGLHPSESIFLA